MVVELKRGTDPNVHMQAITYAALVAGFSKATLADAHAEYLNRRIDSEKVSVDEASEALNDHVDGTWDDDILTVPKIVCWQRTSRRRPTRRWLGSRISRRT